MIELISLLLHSRTQSQVFHWRVTNTGSYAAHAALQVYYENIVGILDGIVESYQGKYGIQQFKSVNGLDNDASIENIISYFEKLDKFVASRRKSDDLNHSFIQNEIDNIELLLNSTLYKLKNLS
jgi:DNA-binding ferritin-like protein